MASVTAARRYCRPASSPPRGTTLDIKTPIVFLSAHYRANPGGGIRRTEDRLPTIEATSILKSKKLRKGATKIAQLAPERAKTAGFPLARLDYLTHGRQGQ